ncbi:oligomeric Golgi complex subunit 6 [Phakopsora pachyrhizi]|uniref:Conserved oligomeric Golgi complex subunit 6 n=1 Tax=Phakopsora pachyrhizi TaxID=170000 RepID=A0AAV0AU77_PHAPC|nr:oligomeric Golgi complex subunit 6 [Phakopsora pachyrhizi]CAH7673261.1 oligomeric Golgi complex subunit 6 [Phakopsora pachyrhizi]
MHQHCDEVENQLNSSNVGTRFLLQHADGLRKESQSVTTKQLLAKAFLHRFTLSDVEVQALTNREVQVNHDLFSAINHCHQIRLDCAVLLAGDTTQTQTTQTAGLDIMQSTSKYLDKAYEKVARWTMLECRNGLIKVDDSQTEVSLLMKKAINCLKSRPQMLEETISILTTSRSTSLLNLFLDALTRGGPSGLPRPIELNAHDPIRYVGDMLAWVHQVMASEHEFLESLFNVKSTGKRRMMGESRVFASAQSDHKSEEDKIITVNSEVEDWDRVLKLLDRNLEGCTRPLKIRVLQTIKSQESSLVAYQLTSLLEFYKTTMAATIGPDSKLTNTLIEITTEAYGTVYSLLRALSMQLISSLEPPPADLSVPIGLNESMANLKEIMSIYEASLEDYPMEKSFGRVLDLVIDPMLELVEKMAEMLSRKLDQLIFCVNCLEHVQNTLGDFEFTKLSSKKVKLRLEENLTSLIQEHFKYLLNISGLQPVLEAIENKDPETPLSRVKNGDSKSITKASEDFEKFLIDLDPINSAELSLIRSTRLRSKVHRQGLNLIYQAYETLWDQVNNKSNRFEFVSMILIRSKDEVNTLIG